MAHQYMAKMFHGPQNINLEKVLTDFKLFLGHTMRNNIYLNFQDALRRALLPKSLQVSMSIGNYDYLTKNQSETHNKELIDTGFCGPVGRVF